MPPQLSQVSGHASLIRVPLYVKSQPSAVEAVAQSNGLTKSLLSEQSSHESQVTGHASLIRTPL